MQIRRPANHFAHFDEETRAVIGLYNSNRHSAIPTPNIPISAQQRDAVVDRPLAFFVTEDGTLESESVAEKDDVTEDLSDSLSIYDRTIGAGVIVKGICYYADDAASAHMTQCLLLAKDQSECKLKAVIDREPCYVTVKGKNNLKEIVQAVNALRTEAKELQLERDVSIMRNAD